MNEKGSFMCGPFKRSGMGVEPWRVLTGLTIGLVFLMIGAILFDWSAEEAIFIGAIGAAMIGMGYLGYRFGQRWE